MALACAQVSVGTSATLLAQGESDGTRVTLLNKGAADVFLGPSGVTTTAGLALAAGASFATLLEPGENIYGIVASGTCTVHVLRSGV